MRGINRNWILDTGYWILESRIKNLGSILSLLLLWACAFAAPLGVLWSCQPQEKPNLSLMSAEQRKAALLKQLDQKFENPDVHFELGQLYQAQSQWAEAERRYDIAIRFDPAHRRAQAAMVKVLANSGDTAKAEQYAKAYMNQASNSAMASLQLAQAFDKQDLDDYALACYQQALRVAPDSPEVNKQVGYYYLNNNDKTRAKDYLSRSFQLNPNQPDVAGELGRLGVVVKIP
ncbi:MAG: tetratricopeptide repeat protein [Phycisphaerae bacterium]